MRLGANPTIVANSMGTRAKPIPYSPVAECFLTGRSHAFAPPAVAIVNVEVAGDPSGPMVSVLGRNVQFAPVGIADELQDRAIVPVNPFCCVPLMVKLAELPAGRVVLSGLAARPKSGTSGVTFWNNAGEVLATNWISPLYSAVIL